MEGLVVIIIILVVVSNLRKQTKGRSSSGNGTPYKPAQNAPRDVQPGQRAPAEGAPTEAAGQGSPARPVRKPFAPRPLTPVAPMGPLRPASSAKPVSPAHPAQPAAPAPAETMLPERPVQPMRAPAQPELCDDGYGSIAHARHEGEEFHAPGTHSLTGKRPGELAAGSAQAAAASSDEAMPELLGLELDAETMRRAVVFSEIINKRGGRHGWVRI